MDNVEINSAKNQKEHSSFERQTAIKTVEQLPCDTSLTDSDEMCTERCRPDLGSNKTSATQSQVDRNCDTIKKPVRVKFAIEPEIYSKFNIKIKSKSKGLEDRNTHNYIAGKTVDTEEQLLPPRSSVLVNKNSMSTEKKVTTAPSLYKLVNRVQVLDKDKVKNNRMTRCDTDKKSGTKTNEEIPDINTYHVGLISEKLTSFKDKVAKMSIKTKVDIDNTMLRCPPKSREPRSGTQKNDNHVTKNLIHINKYTDKNGVEKEIKVFETTEQKPKSGEKQPNIVKDSDCEIESGDNVVNSNNLIDTKAVQKSHSNKLLFGRGTDFKKAKSDEKCAVQNQSERSCDTVKKPVRVKFTTEPYIYSKFNVKSTNECLEGKSRKTAKKTAVTDVKLQTYRSPVSIIESSSSKKKVKTASSWYKNNSNLLNKSKQDEQTKKDSVFIFQAARKNEQQPQSNKLLIDHGLEPSIKSDKSSESQNHSEKRCDTIKKPVRVKFTSDPHIYSKFNIKNTNECLKGIKTAKNNTMA